MGEGEGEKDVSRVCVVGTEAQLASVCVWFERGVDRLLSRSRCRPTPSVSGSVCACVCLREKPVDRLVSRSRCHPTPSVLGSVGVCVGGGGAVTLTYLYSYKKTELVMMVFLPSCNIGHPIYIRRT